MKFWSHLKSTFTRRPYLDSSLSTMNRFSSNQAQTRPFNQHLAVSKLHSWAYSAAMLNAHAVASVPLRLYMRRRPGQHLFKTQSVSHSRKSYLAGDHQEKIRPSTTVFNKVASWGNDYVQVTEPHPITELLSTVNPYANGFELTVLRMLYLQVTGNCYIHPVIDPVYNRPSELWIMPSQWTQIVPSKQNFIDGYLYGATMSQRHQFKSDEVIHWKLPNIEDLFYGKGCLEAIWSALSLHESKRDMDVANFNNHSRPDYLLIVKQGATSDALERFEKEVDRKLRGTRQSGKFIAITGDVEAKPLNFPPDVIGDSDRIVEEIAAGFGVPVSKLLANHPNRSGAETADRAWLRDTVLPYCRLDEEKLNEKYLPMFGIEQDAFLAYDNPVPEDKQFQLKRRSRYVQLGIMTANEVRAEEGLPPLEATP